MTTLNITLSDALQTALGSPTPGTPNGVWAYAVYFDSDGNNPVWTPLVVNGAIQSGGVIPVDLPTPMIGGKVYLIVQNQDPTKGDTLQAELTSESTVNWNNAATHNFRFDSMEVTLTPSPFDAGNLTSVNGFGLAMRMAVPYDNGTTGSAGYGITAASLVDAIDAIDPTQTYSFTYAAVGGQLDGQFRMAFSPSESLAQSQNTGSSFTPPFQADDWDGYIEAVGTALEAATDPLAITLSGTFNGAPDAAQVWHNSGFFAYQASTETIDDPSTPEADLIRVFWLEPMANSQIKGSIRITADNLANSIYSTLGSADIYTQRGDATPFLADMNTGLNNQWGKVLLGFLTGFTGGFLGAEGTSPNGQISTSIDLSNTINWEPTYAFGANLSATLPGDFQKSDAYSRIFYESTNSYGSGYSDALMSRYPIGGPLLSVSQPDTGANVGTIELTIFADDEQPEGYTQPVLYNYIAPDAGGYTVPTHTSVQSNIVLNLAAGVAGNTGIVVDEAQTVTLRIMTDNGGGTGAPTWTEVVFDADNGGAFGLWQNWNIQYDGGTGTYSAVPFGSPVQQPAGSLLINQMPAADSGKLWYQIEVGGKTFNLYATTQGGFWVNPAAPGNAGALAVDGLASIAVGPPDQATIPSFTLGFTNGDALAFDPSIAVLNYAGVSSMPAPDAPVAGTLAGDAFTAFANQVNATTNTITVTQADIAFGWTGLNPLSIPADPNPSDGVPPPPPWTSVYTNKVDGLTVARITITGSIGDPIHTTATADIDGAWRTPSVHLSNGAYTVTMQGFSASDTGFANPITPVSSALNLTVDALTEVVPCFLAGTRIATVEGDIPVQALRVGDRVRLASGGERAIVWIGQRDVHCARHPVPATVRPIRIQPGALGPGVPARALFLSPDHALFLDGVLIPVKHLVNGSSIRQMRRKQARYYHIELDRHDVLLAEGAPAESYLDTGDRANFINGGRVVNLHPSFGALRREAGACARLVVTGPPLERVRARLEEIATAA